MLKPWIVEFVAIFRPSMGNPSSSCHHVPSQGGSGGARKGPVGVEVGDLDGAMASDWSDFLPNVRTCSSNKEGKMMENGFTIG